MVVDESIKMPIQDDGITLQSRRKRGRPAKKSSDVGAEEEGGSRQGTGRLQGSPGNLVLGMFMSECNVDLCLMQMPPSIELAADDDDFEDEGVPAPSAKTTRHEKTSKGKGKGRAPSSSQPLPVRVGVCVGGW